MFYELQSQEAKNEYKEQLTLVGSLSNLFSTSNIPYLSYRAQENIFCSCFYATNLSRSDKSVDAMKNKLGIGLKTWVESSGVPSQKIAEFNLLASEYKDSEALPMIQTVSRYRNKRIHATKKLYGLNRLIYHIVERVPAGMKIYEGELNEINIPSIKRVPEKDTLNNIYFKDLRHTYHFNTAKNTLYLHFDFLAHLDTFTVNILDDPIAALRSMQLSTSNADLVNQQLDVFSNSICLRLYSIKADGEKVVYPKSGLNQWNASGRKRHPDEIYIPYPQEDQKLHPNFFPPRNHPFLLHLPDGQVIPAKVCQDNDKAIMSNPNRILGKWLLRDVFSLPEHELITYKTLEIFGIDSVVFTKLKNDEYSIDFTELGTYERWQGLLS